MPGQTEPPKIMMTEEDAAKTEAEQLIAAYKARRRDQPAEPPATLSQPIPPADPAGEGAAGVSAGTDMAGGDAGGGDAGVSGAEATDGSPGNPTA